MIITDKTATLTTFRIQSSVSSQLDLEKKFSLLFSAQFKGNIY